METRRELNSLDEPERTLMPVEAGEWDKTDGVGQAWTVDELRARTAQERQLELRAQAADEIATRDQAIRDAALRGVPPRQLARVVGMSRQTIYEILGTEPDYP